MKLSAALSLGVAHLALGKSVQNVAPVRREPSRGDDNRQFRGQGSSESGLNEVIASQVELAELQSLFGVSTGNNVEINFLWVNVGGGAATTVLNQVQTVTVTETLGSTAGAVVAAPPVAGAPPPVAGAPGQVAASPTQVAGASGVVSGVGATHSVTVGGPGGLAFNPAQIPAAIGDTVIFTFLSQNHTATQSAFTTPCDPLSGGMDSGFQANPNNTVNPPPQVAMQVMVSTPLWFFCRQNGHCGKGMTFSINPTANKTQAMFQAMAIAQKGQGTGSAITGNGGAPAAAAPGAPAGAGAPPAAAVGAGSPVASSPSAGGTGVVTGTGTLASDGSCLCAVSCQFGGSFPVSAQGAGSFGGFGGALPMNAIPARKF